MEIWNLCGDAVRVNNNKSRDKGKGKSAGDEMKATLNHNTRSLSIHLLLHRWTRFPWLTLPVCQLKSSLDMLICNLSYLHKHYATPSLRSQSQLKTSIIFRCNLCLHEWLGFKLLRQAGSWQNLWVYQGNEKVCCVWKIEIENPSHDRGKNMRTTLKSFHFTFIMWDIFGYKQKI